MEAAAQDDELAAIMVAREAGEDDGGSNGSFRISEFGPNTQLLVGIFDRLGQIAAIVGHADKPPAPFPRPETAQDRVARRVADDAYEYILAQVESARAAIESVEGG